MPFEFEPTSIPEVILVKPRVFPDARGFFLESYQEESFKAGGISAHFVQDNHSRSNQGVLRGLHFQLTQPQAKLLRVVQGAIYDVAVDIRRGSPTFGQWAAALLTAENHHQFFVPRGFAHGFEVLSETAEVLYKADDFYNPSDESGILWNDPALGIDWRSDSPLLSEKDQTLLPLHEMPAEGLPVYSPPSA
ncbi:MAG: dTDP-4-dehydrorhamnose 3,5-epimerase [Planctomycetota bacterium]|jgi:dTDP-4-dehydrorhamnose 3,5-epimerase